MSALSELVTALAISGQQSTDLTPLIDACRTEAIAAFKERLKADVVLIQGKYLPGSNQYSPEKVKAFEEVLILIDPSEMTPIDQQKVLKLFGEAYGMRQPPSSDEGFKRAIKFAELIQAEAHREYQERVATLTEAATDVLTLIDFGLPLDEIDKKKIEQLRAALSPPPAKQQEP